MLALKNKQNFIFNIKAFTEYEIVNSYKFRINILLNKNIYEKK